MLKYAKKIVEEEGADFIATGEVIGQRPFSQTRERFEVIDREAGVEGLVVRPLSGKLLPETVPEKRGLVKREDLMEFKDKTRRSQIELAKELGIETYPTPAGGCLLTEPAFGRRFKDLQKYNPQFSMKDAVLLRFGRHFRLNKDNKIIVCRNKTENETILNYVPKDDVLFELVDYNGPLCVYFGELTEDAMEKAASYTVSYSKASKDKPSKVRFWNLRGTFQKLVETSPLPLEKMHKNLI
jgi:tRNA U34 2-thiouridine synthase MnmA/TrmU